jgi:hypothetical protein
VQKLKSFACYKVDLLVCRQFLTSVTYLNMWNTLSYQFTVNVKAQQNIYSKQSLETVLYLLLCLLFGIFRLLSKYPDADGKLTSQLYDKRSFIFPNYFQEIIDTRARKRIFLLARRHIFLLASMKECMEVNLHYNECQYSEFGTFEV